MLLVSWILFIMYEKLQLETAFRAATKKRCSINIFLKWVSVFKTKLVLVLDWFMNEPFNRTIGFSKLLPILKAIITFIGRPSQTITWVFVAER